ncbi:MAG TPA: glycosyltransferase family 2 protein [Candidatus Acidoferrales bacterium]|nr:glycosyltransferase family 2 protein [Candidatus Acidoferrales bacterium]
MSDNSNPLVSIITPTYNHEKFVGACIESVLRQSYQNWEMVIIDDGSTDRTAEVISQYRDSRIRYFYQENQGIEALAHTYNRALEIATGSLIAILEGDDAWPSNKLVAQVPKFHDPDVVLAFGEETDMDVNGRPAKAKSRTGRKRKKLPRPTLFNDPVRSSTGYLLSMHGQSFIPPATVVIRRSSLEAIGEFQYVAGICPTDVPTFLRLSLLGKFHYAQDVLGFRRRHFSSATLRFLQPMSTTPQDFMFKQIDSPELALGEAQREAIKKTWRPRTSTREFATGRLFLIEHRWANARHHFIRAIHPGQPRVLAGAVAGWLLSWVHSDLEGLFRLAGRVPLKPSE